MTRIARVTAVVTALATLACAGERLEKLERQQAELQSETARLARDLADLRRSGAAPSAAPVASPSEALSSTAVTRAILDAWSRTLPPPATALDAPIEGVWRSTGGSDDEEVLHLGLGGRLCGYRRPRQERSEKRPFWGRWERHGRLLVVVRDRWVGDHNEYDAELRTLESLTSSTLVTTGERPLSSERVAKGDWSGLASLYENRRTPIPGLPDGCLTRE